MELVDLTTLLRSSDCVSIHCPLTAETRHLFNAQTLRQMKPTAWLISTSRGGIVDESALAEALAAGRLGGAALDVLSVEPPPPDLPLLDLEDVILTPHVASYSETAMAELQRLAALQVRTVLLGGQPQWPVNVVVGDGH